MTQVHAARERGPCFADQLARVLSKTNAISKASAFAPMRGDG
jgi:hypothetical protein